MNETERQISLAELAAVLHGATAALGRFEGPVVPWDELSHRDRALAIIAVQKLLDEEPKTVIECHEVWHSLKTGAGWSHGEYYDQHNKKHPCLVPFESKATEGVAIDVMKEIAEHGGLHNWM